MKPFSNLDAIIQDGYSFECQMPDGYGMPGVQEVKISTHQIGDLILTSGKVLAWDPLMGPDWRYTFKENLKPGSYPVIVSVAHFHPSGECRIACATLRICYEQVVKWKLASMNWANIRLGDSVAPNIIVFSSGWGDGGYASFWGSDASGNIAVLTTDFALF